MIDGGVRYCLDTSAWIDGWRRYYPIATFPSVWRRIGQLVDAGRLLWVDEVANEMLDPDLNEWLLPHAAGMMETDADIWNEASRLQKLYNPDLHPNGITGADAFIIAASRIHALQVVTGEKTGHGRPRIPNICTLLNLPWGSFLSMMQQEQWTF